MHPPLSGSAPAKSPTAMAGVVERNIRALLAHRQDEERKKGLQDRLADAITRFTGSMTFVYAHVVFFGLWIAINLGWVPGVPQFDETFVVLAMVASVEAIFLSTFVLISQNRMAALADKRADLDLQVSLLAEHEVTRLIYALQRDREKAGHRSLARSRALGARAGRATGKGPAEDGRNGAQRSWRGIARTLDAGIPVTARA